MVKEFKKELSKLSGIDFFNPKYRDVFKKYFPDESSDADTDEDAKSSEEERLEELIGEEANEEESKTPEEQTTQQDAEDVVEEEAERFEPATTSEQTEDTTAATESNEETMTEDTSTSSEDNKVSQELLETKVELELLKAGVRKDRLQAARILIMGSIHSVDDLAKVSELIKEYPEWLSKPEPAKPFGIPLENGGGFTEEEKRLREMGIDPRS